MAQEPLKEFRTRVGLTQGEMASRMGLSLRQYQDVESGAAPMREVYRLSQDMISIYLALEPERPGGSALTENAIKVIDAVAPRIRPEDRLRAGLHRGARASLSSDERNRLALYEAGLPGPLTDEQVLYWVEGSRALAADRSHGQVRVDSG